jgi:hypothetical protein
MNHRKIMAYGIHCGTKKCGHLENMKGRRPDGDTWKGRFIKEMGLDSWIRAQHRRNLRFGGGGRQMPFQYFSYLRIDSLLMS